MQNVLTFRRDYNIIASPARYTQRTQRISRFVCLHCTCCRL